MYKLNSPDARVRNRGDPINECPCRGAYTEIETLFYLGDTPFPVCADTFPLFTIDEIKALRESDEVLIDGVS